MPVAEMLQRMSSAELTEWMAYYMLEPFGTEIDLYGHAMTTSTIMNVVRKKGAKEIQPADVMPDFEKSKKASDVDSMIAMAEYWTAAMGGTDKRKRK